jgi:tungstate transport system substrate-binding protein
VNDKFEDGSLHSGSPNDRGSAIRRWLGVFGLLAAILGFCPTGLQAATPDQSIIVASTTSTEQSGLFDFLLPKFTTRTGIAVKVVAVGTGQALDIGRRGDADVVFVHDRPAEDQFMTEGQGVRRFDVMYNDFVLIGPKSDPAKIAGGKDVIQAFRAIAATHQTFISRGDRSGTNAMELRYWKAAGLMLDPSKGGWYREIGQGMGPALNMASASDAYVLSDRGTWLAFKNRGQLAILVQGDQRLLNPYGVMLVNPASVKAKMLTVMLRTIRISPRASASDKSPELVSRAMAVVMVRVWPRILPPTMMIAPTSDMARPKAARNAVKRPLRPIENSSARDWGRDAPWIRNRSPYCDHSGSTAACTRAITIGVVNTV